jgi:CrcB protein
MSSYLAIALGSALGGFGRFAIGALFQAWLGAAFPWGTLFINVTGSLAIGFFNTLTGPEGRVYASARLRLLVMTGICGGYTTFSAFSLEAVRLAEAGAWASAGLYVALSLALCLICVWLGHVGALALNRLHA